MARVQLTVTRNLFINFSCFYIKEKNPTYIQYTLYVCTYKIPFENLTFNKVLIKFKEGYCFCG